MGYAVAMGLCLVCRAPFGFNPNAVPSYRVNGNREPICESCMTVINAKRSALGLEPFPIRADAYAPINEEEL